MNFTHDIIYLEESIYNEYYGHLVINLCSYDKISLFILHHTAYLLYVLHDVYMTFYIYVK